jgi:hypothetical protein
VTDQQHDDASCGHIRRQDQHDNPEAAPGFLLKHQRGLNPWNDNFIGPAGWFAFCRRDRTLTFIACYGEVGKGFAEMRNSEVAESAAPEDCVTPDGL